MRAAVLVGLGAGADWVAAVSRGGVIVTIDEGGAEVRFVSADGLVQALRTTPAATAIPSAPALRHATRARYRARRGVRVFPAGDRLRGRKPVTSGENTGAPAGRSAGGGQVYELPQAGAVPGRGAERDRVGLRPFEVQVCRVLPGEADAAV